MTHACVFLGDAVTAAGLRLAGVRCESPGPAEAAGVFRRARHDAALLLLSAELAEALPPELLAEALREQRPPTLVIGDLRGQQAPPDRVAALKRQLGLAE